jgi:hypothetical protein
LSTSRPCPTSVCCTASPPSPSAPAAPSPPARALRTPPQPRPPPLHQPLRLIVLPAAGALGQPHRAKVSGARAGGAFVLGAGLGVHAGGYGRGGAREQSSWASGVCSERGCGRHAPVPCVLAKSSTGWVVLHRGLVEGRGGVPSPQIRLEHRPQRRAMHCATRRAGSAVLCRLSGARPQHLKHTLVPGFNTHKEARQARSRPFDFPGWAYR